MNSLAQLESIEIESSNQILASMPAADIVAWSAETFGDKLALLSSFGADSGLMIKMLAESGLDVGVVTIDTGFLFPATIEHRNRLQDRFGFNLHIISPTAEQIEYVEETRLWEHDLDRYHELTKLAPLRNTIQQLGITALMSGVRSWQTEHRSEKEILEIGQDGEYRIHPLLFWTRQESDEYMADVEKHPLVSKGYESIGDWTTTTPGRGRSGRQLGEKLECGLHRAGSSAWPDTPVSFLLPDPEQARINYYGTTYSD
jgi:phosphoadenosine phosphosulfate reductase